MFGNFTEGRNEKELNKGHYELSNFPFLSFFSYLNFSGIMCQKFLFMIRYFIKIGIRIVLLNILLTFLMLILLYLKMKF